MKPIRPNTIPVLFCCMITATFITPADAVETFKWNDGAGANNWVASGNWNQTPGGGDYPGQKQNNDLVHLYGGFSNNSGKFDVDLTTSSTPSSGIITVANMLVSTDSSSDQWVLNKGAQTSPLLKVSSEIGFLLQNSGTFISNVDLGFVDNRIGVGVQGGTAVFNGKVIGDASKILDANTTSVGVDGDSSVVGGTLQLAAANNDAFFGTVDVGWTKVDLAQVNGLRNATVNLDLDNRFSYVDNALLGALTGARQLTLVNRLQVGNKNTDFTYTGSMSGSGSLYKKGTGTWTLGGASTYTGTTYIDAGKIKLTHANALQNSQVNINVSNGLNLNGTDATVGGLGGSGSLALGSSQLTVSGSGDYLHLGTISGTGSIQIDMSGSQDFGSGNTYSGGTVLRDGTLKCQTESDLGATSGALTIGPATFHATGTHAQNRALKFMFTSTLATIEVDSGKTLTWSGQINDPSSSQTLRKMGAGILAISNDSNVYSGTIQIENGTVEPSSNSLTNARIVMNTNNGLTLSGSEKSVGSLAGSGALHLGADLTIGGHSGSDTYSGSLSQTGSKALTQTGPSIQTFSGTSSRNGATIINGGTLNLQNLTESPLGSGLVSVNAGGTLTGNGIVGSSVAVYSGGTITTSSSTSSLAISSLTLQGTFDCIIAGSNASKLIETLNVTLTGSTLNLQGTPSQSAYVLITYGGTLTGTFATIQNLPAGYKIDYAYNGKNVALVEDNTAPTVTNFTTAEASPNNATSIAYSVTFSEPISGLVDYTDFYITGTTVAGTDITASTVVDSGGGTNFTITLNNLSGDGLLQFRLKANQIADLAGNNLASDPFSPGLTIDNTAPVLALNGDAALTLDFGAAWSDPGATTDDGSTVIIGGDTVNTSVPTIYTLTYDATDTAGNIATQLTRSVTVRTAYLSWSLANGLTEGVNDGLTDNPDGDNWNNRAEYALNGDPLSSSNNWKVVGGLADVNGTNYLTRTFPVLDGTVFLSSPSKTGVNGDVAYVVSGYTNLITQFPQIVIELSPALTNGMPILDSGWNYHSFRLNKNTEQNPAAFLKLKVGSSVP